MRTGIVCGPPIWWEWDADPGHVPGGPRLEVTASRRPMQRVSTLKPPILLQIVIGPALLPHASNGSPLHGAWSCGSSFRNGCRMLLLLTRRRLVRCHYHPTLPPSIFIGADSVVRHVLHPAPNVLNVGLAKRRSCYHCRQEARDWGCSKPSTSQKRLL